MKTFWLASFNTSGLIAIGLAFIGLGAGGLYYRMHASEQEGVHQASASATSGQAVPPNQAEDVRAGALHGVIRVTGELPAPQVIMQLPSGIVLHDESLLVDPETSGLANVVVYLEKPPARAKIPAVPVAPVNVSIADGKFAPHMIGVRVGQPVKVTNRDAEVRNFHTNPNRNSPINKMLDPAAFFTNVYNRPERIPLLVRNDLHDWMKHYEMVIDHPWFAVTDREGRFAIDDLPAGQHEFIFWHELAGYLERRDPIRIVSGETLDVTRVYEAKRFTNPTGGTK